MNRFQLIEYFIIIAVFFIMTVFFAACQQKMPALHDDRTISYPSVSGDTTTATTSENNTESTAMATVEVTTAAGTDTEINPGAVPSEESGLEINVVTEGADPTGKEDNTDLLIRLHKTGKRIYYPNGTYIFNGTTLDLSGGLRFESKNGVRIRNSISDVNIVNFDDNGNLIGLMQNHLEKNEYNIKAESGSLVPPPLSIRNFVPKVDVIAYWYNDFGLKCHLPAGRGTGWIGWHYWTWNQHGCEDIPGLLDYYKRYTQYTSVDPYDPSRHPLLGFYRGDDPVVLDWQAYWMHEYGINAVSLLNQGKNGLAGWEEPSHRDHWLYQLFNNVKNFKKLKYVMNGEYSFPPSAYTEFEDKRVREKFFELVDKIYSKYDNYYYIEKDGKKYPVISILEETQYVNFMGSADNVASFYLELSERFRSHGFGGFTLFVRNPIMKFKSAVKLKEMEKQGILRYETSYTPNFTTTAFINSNNCTYKDVVDSFDPPSSKRVVISVATSLDTQTPHGSNWRCPGSSPKLFQEYMEKAVGHLEKNPEMINALMCYNVSEWAESGPGLVPNVKNRFGYLEAIRNTVKP